MARDFVARSYFELLDDPPTSIGVFQSIEQDLCRDRDALLFDTSQDVLRAFLVKYFSEMVVSEVLVTHTEARHSSLGIEYFLRGGFGLFGLRVLVDVPYTLAQIDVDITEVEDVAEHSTDDSSWTEVTPRRSTRIATQSRVAEGRGGRDGGGGRDRWGRGGRSQRDRGGGRGEQSTSVFFGGIRTVDIWLPTFVTPEKGPSAAQAIHRRTTIQDRSTLFQERVMSCVPDLRVYDPFDVEIADVTLYHGFRSSSWVQFHFRGIDPLHTRNDFSIHEAFYGSNSLAQAFEHPLHNHPRLYAGDLVSILVFRIPVDILHGDRAPPGDGSPFAVRWFEYPDLAWQTFCEGNLFSPISSRGHGFDIVIGPSCLPLGGRQVTVLEFGDHGERLQPTQVAFCSRRAMTWLNTCAVVLLQERRSCSSYVHNPRDDDIENQKTYSQKELDQAKKQLQRAFLEFYRSLSLLSSYRSVNITAFAKIMKKYDKVTGWHLAPIYMKEVESSYFVVSKKIHKLSTKVEDIYTKHFSNGDRKKANAQLRPVRKQGTHRTTFFLGVFSGCSLALFISFFFLVANPLALDRGGGTTYLNTVFPVFSTLMLIAIHLYFYAFNVYAWQRTRINYPFIFGFSPGSELRYRQLLLLSTGFTTFLLGGINIHIAVTLLTHPDPVPAGEVAASPTAPKGSTVTDVIPMILVLILAIVFLRLLSTSGSRTLVQGDQFTSQVLVFRNLEFIACYYSGGFFLTQQDQVCKKNAIYQGFGYVVALLPYWWRFLQCLRRYHDEKDKHQLQNAGKYMSAIIAVGLRQAYTNYCTRPGYELPLLVLFVIASIIATVFTTFWDICHDWSLLKKSKNKWLRDKIILKNKSIYFVAIGTNSILRLAWLATLLQVQSFGFNQNAFDVIMASLEILRRGIWNFFRIENEHLNNVGKYRAEKSVPLPFNDDM